MLRPIYSGGNNPAGIVKQGHWVHHRARLDVWKETMIYCSCQESKTRLSKQQPATYTRWRRARSSGDTPHVCQQLRCSKNSGVAAKQSAAPHITDTAADFGKECITDNTVSAYAL